MTEYQKQLKDPRWQKKRLEIMERDEWTCQSCGDSKSTLTVHHKSYRFDGESFADIWDYDNCDLITLCEPCHTAEEAALSVLQKNLYFNVRDKLESSQDFQAVVDILSLSKDKLGRRLTYIDLYDIHGIITEGIVWGK